MRPAPEGYADALTRPQVRRVTEVTSWLGGTFLGTVPVKSGTLAIDATADVPGSLTLTVPSNPTTRPTHDGHMLAAAGQQLVVRRSLVDKDGEPSGWFEHGRYRIMPSRATRGVLQVKAVSLERSVELARFTAPTAFPASTYAGTLAALLRGLLAVRVVPGVVDRPIPARLWERERLDAVQEVIAAWGNIEGFVHNDGVFEVRQLPASTTPLITLTDGPGGTVQDVTPGADAADPIANAFVTATVPDGGSLPISETALLQVGPRRWGGPYGYVPKFFASSLMTNRAQLRDAAVTGLAREQLGTSQWDVTCLSDDRIERGDCVRVVQVRQNTDMIGRVVGYTVPITRHDEPARVTITALSGRAYGQPVGVI